MYVCASSAPATHRSRTSLTFALVATAVAICTVVYLLRIPILRELGSALVHSDPLASADVIVITLDSGGAGALEAADLVRQGLASKVAVFADLPSVEAAEFLHRGLVYEDRADRQSRQLALLGVINVLRIPAAVTGTTDETDLIPAWCRDSGFKSVIVVTTTDHSRRTHRALARSMPGTLTRFSVRPSRYSTFDPERWWHSRSGTRLGIVELQKLALDFATHPLN